DPREQLRLRLHNAGRAMLWSLLEGQRLRLDPPLLLPRPTDLPDPGAAGPRVAFGPFSSDDALRALTHVPEKPDWLTDALRPRPERPQLFDLWAVYENDGGGM